MNKEKFINIKYNDFAQIIQAIRDTKEFDGMDDIDDFMEKLDDMKESELEVREFRGVITFKIHGE